MLPKTGFLSSCWSNFMPAWGFSVSLMQQNANSAIWLQNHSSTLVLMQFLYFHSLIQAPNWVLSFQTEDRSVSSASAKLEITWAGDVMTPWPQLLSFLLMLLAAKLNTKPDLTWCPDSAWPCPNHAMTTIALSSVKFIWTFPRVCCTTRYWQVTKLVHDAV